MPKMLRNLFAAQRRWCRMRILRWKVRQRVLREAGENIQKAKAALDRTIAGWKRIENVHREEDRRLADLEKSADESLKNLRTMSNEIKQSMQQSKQSMQQAEFLISKYYEWKARFDSLNESSPEYEAKKASLLEE